MKIRGIIFDLDGTLLDSMGIWETVGEDYLATMGIAPEDHLREDLKELDMEQAAVYFQEHYGIDKPKQKIVDEINKIVEEFYLFEAGVKNGVQKFLEMLQQKGVKMCIATATDRYLVEAALARCGISEYFSFILTCSEVGSGKDEPLIYEKALELLGTAKEETFVFEDAAHAAATAKKAGFTVVGIRDKYEERQEQVRSLADFYLEDYCEADILMLQSN